ncbi:HesA/MoeB/ThiF family protein [Sphingomonas sp. HDW15A]|uniref:HesA/MoeB/ThiF family protein n=1 Tax=Sphingomonas sp. HDW15A TaxID=2714942 RepID=UPI00140C49EB|nr:HesA/MoeB/ThiF family protein [Sphingomonas sp. HDW15A]QIK96204.1 HesA/MoeB/ThiF family protein [Sphingomonas sp. HDW15A]
MPLSDEELDRYARQLVLPQFGGLGQQRLKAAKVAVIGAGGIGSSVIPALACAGVGALTIVDGDRVELANLPRQPIFTSSQVGMGKALLASHWVMSRNAHVEVKAVAERLDDANAADIIRGHELVIDGTDNFATRLLVSDTCVALGLPLLSAAAQQFQGQVAIFSGNPCYRCFVGDAFDAEDCDSCAELGVLGATVATVGSYAALMAIRALAGMADDRGTLHLFDAAALEWRRIRLSSDPSCRTCGGQAS